MRILLINCEVESILTCSNECVLLDMTTRDADVFNSPIVAPASATFKTTDPKLHVPVVLCQKKMTESF